MAPRSRQILGQMAIVLAAAVTVAVLVFLWKIDAVSAVLFGDPRPLILNGVILVLFFLGVWQLFKGVKYYGKQEKQITIFMARRAEGYPTEQVLEDFSHPSLLRERHNNIMSWRLQMTNNTFHLSTAAAELSARCGTPS